MSEAGYRIEWSSAARRQLAKLPDPARGRVQAAIEALGGDPRPPSAKALVGTDSLRVRIGDYRAVYEVDDPARLVRVLTVGHRREVYRG